MSERPGPDFDELVGGDLEPEARERLLRVHEALLAAGPPPELTPDLAAPATAAAVVELHRPSRRRLAVAAVLAAALAAAAFGAGFFLGDSGTSSAAPERVIEMTGGDARASLAILPQDEAGNWPMRMTVQGLPSLPAGEEYELWLTRDGKLASPCGAFAVSNDGRTVVSLNAPYRLKEFDGWVVTRRGSNRPILQTV